MAPVSPPICSPASFRLVSHFAIARARPMTPILMILLLIAMAAVVYVLVRGVIAMASGKDVTGEQSQAWMRKRVLFQAVAIALVILILIVAGSSR
jgi:succinate dehydrogenase/fumarate reductase cytochrome b subunit